MINTVLSDNILNFINRIGVVHNEQIMQMFGAEHNPETIEWCIKSLISKSEIDYDFEKHLLKRRQMLSEDSFGQKLLTEAAWILSAMGETEVREYWVVDYPSQLLIISEDNNVYDVTIFTYQTLNSIAMSILSKRSQYIPKNVEDTTIHIAVLPDKKMAKDIENLMFDTYCILDKETKKPTYFEF